MREEINMRLRALESRDAIELLSSKWRIAIIHILRGGPLRTSQIQDAIQEVSAKVLTQTLRGMERDGLLLRVVHSSRPLHVEYSLTEMGTSAVMPLRDLCRWAKQNRPRRDKARVRYDSQTAQFRPAHLPSHQ